MPLLLAQQLTHRYGGVQALDSVDLRLYAGQVLGLLGANGSGKSTLSRILAGDVRPSQGMVSIKGSALRTGSPHAARAAGIAIAHQHPGLAPDLPVWENVFLGIEPCRAAGFLWSAARTRARAADILARLKPDWDIDAPAGRLNAADQQLVEIAKALASAPRVLILDEPSAALADAQVQRLMQMVRGLAQNGCAVVFISHRMAEVATLCDRVLVLCNGRKVGDLAVEQPFDEARVLALMSGVTTRVAASPQRRVKSAEATSRIALRVRGLRAGTRLHGVDFDLKRGEILGITGLEGHGQQEVLNALAGWYLPDGGSVVLNDVPIVPRSPRQMIAAGVCLVPNDRHRQGLWLDHSLAFNLTQATLAFAPRPWRLPRAALRRFVDQVIVRLRIKAAHAQQTVSTLSGGNQQKAVIGRWLGQAMQVLLLSDPTKGVDVIARQEIHAAIGELAETGTAVLLYASDTDELIAVCDRLLVLFEGRVVAQLTGAQMHRINITKALFGNAA